MPRSGLAYVPVAMIQGEERSCHCEFEEYTLRSMGGQSWTTKSFSYRSPYCAEHNPQAFWPEGEC